MKQLVALSIVVGAAVFIVFSNFEQTPSALIKRDTHPSSVRSHAQMIITDANVGAYEIFKTSYNHLDFNQQHTVAHIFGETLFELKGEVGIAYCDASFAFGCYHGFFTRSVSIGGLSVIETLDKGCGAVLEGNPSACRHGIGHGILEYLGTDRLNEALTACLKTTQPDPLAGCTSGVFMEYNVPLVSNEHGEFSAAPRILSDSPYEPCGEVENQFKSSCYFELPQWWEQVYNKAHRKIGELCENLPEKNYVRECFTGYGKVVAPSAQYDPVLTRRHCEEIDSVEGEYFCRASAAWSIFLDGGGIDDSIEVCDKSIPEHSFGCPSDAPHNAP